MTGWVVVCPTSGYRSSVYKTLERATRKVEEIAQAGTCQHAHYLEPDDSEEVR